MLIEIHMLQNHAPSNLNRDDTGSPKDCIFGGVRRARISSQCLKRTIRISSVFRDAVGQVGIGIRSRQFPRMVKEYLIGKGMAEDVALVCQSKVPELAAKKKKEKETDEEEKPEEKETESKEMAQSVFFTVEDIKAVGDCFLQIAEILNNDKNKIKKIKINSEKKTKKEKKEPIQEDLKEAEDVLGVLKKRRNITPDIALFGRMTTSDAFVDVEASTQVAHAISVNKMDQEFDFYTAIDDLQDRRLMKDAGADMMDDIEFTSACFYKYFSIDYAGLVDNLTGQSKDETIVEDAKTLVKKLIPAFIEAAAFVSPSGKQNSFAAHQLPDAILVEVKEENIPVSYANAFLKPIVPSRDKDLSEAAIEALKTYKENIQQKYDLRISHSFWFTTKDIRIEKTIDCDTLSVLLEKTKTLL
ncbi:MAG TPA: type I-E CRISPR-associated protein Cas7/Cse4/CasC [Thermotogota bacterium]|nr:type I-E CRISPR-associated protein Cas7/Cse4/CasC [Thermotogota bacterium]